MVEILVGLLGFAAVGLLLLRDYRRVEARKREEAEAFFGLLAAELDGAIRKKTGIAGVDCLEGRIGGHFVQFKTVTDTLSVRKLPSLWLMITLPGEIGLSATLDMMMRPAGQTSFSNFDFLPDTLPRPAGFPEDAVLKSDDEAKAPSPELFRPFLKPFTLGFGKELLASAKGVRMVVQVAEADRARYGVLRQAHFACQPLRPDHVLPLVAMLKHLKSSLIAEAAEAQPIHPSRIAAHG